MLFKQIALLIHIKWSEGQEKNDKKNETNANLFRRPRQVLERSKNQVRGKMKLIPGAKNHITSHNAHEREGGKQEASGKEHPIEMHPSLYASIEGFQSLLPLSI